MYKFSQIKKAVAKMKDVSFITDKDENNHDYISIRLNNEKQINVTKTGEKGGLLIEWFDNGIMTNYKSVNNQTEVIKYLNKLIERGF